jgi:hypothetical protein
MTTDAPAVSHPAPPASKPWWKSKTIIFNVLVVMLAAAELQWSLVKDFVPGNVFTWVAFGLPVANAALRFVTSMAVTK